MSDRPRRLVHHPRYDIHVPLLGWLHPFDGRKFSRARSKIESRTSTLDIRSPQAPLDDGQAASVHTRQHLEAITRKDTLAAILEIPALRMLTSTMIQERIVLPMRWASAGTILATNLALADGGVSFNLGGGFHHAFDDHGEGFCVFADLPIAIRMAISDGLLQPEDRIIVIDLDAHRGNGFEAICHQWPVAFFDMYNAQAYPGMHDEDEESEHSKLIPLRAGTNDDTYLRILENELPPFLSANPPRLAFYNAGTDVIATDRIGGLGLTPDGVRRRDHTVLKLLSERDIPTVTVTSGGYSRTSAGLIADMINHAAAAP